MQPSQILPGVQRGSQHSWSWGTLAGKSYLAFGCGNAVVVASGALKVLQHLPLESRVACVHFSSRDAKLAACSGRKVYVFAPATRVCDSPLSPTDDEDPRWEHLLDVMEGFPVSAVHWLEPIGVPTSSLVVAGTHLSVLTLSSAPPPGTPQPGLEPPKPTVATRWRRELGRPIASVSCSPDGRFIATVGSTDELVKVWYASPASPLPPDTPLPSPPSTTAPVPMRHLRMSSIMRSRSPTQPRLLTGVGTPTPSGNAGPGQEMSFLYLRHPASVLQVSWRRHKRSAVEQPANNVDENVLMTVAADGVVRLWCLQQQADSTPAPVPQYKRPRFHLCGTIATGPGSLVEWVGTLCTPPRPSSSQTQQGLKSQQPFMHEDDDREYHSHTECPLLGMHTAAARKLTPGDVDWIVEVTRGGSIVIWKFRTIPYQMPTITVWSKLNFLRGTTPTRSIVPVAFAYTTPLPTPRSAPTALWLYVNNQSGTVSCWSITRISSEVPIKLQAELTSQMFGHRGSVTSIVAHPTNPFVASLDADKNVVIWRCEDNKPYDHPWLMHDICSFGQYSMLAWVPNALAFMASSGASVYTYGLEESVCSSGSRCRAGSSATPPQPGGVAEFPHFLLGMLDESENLTDISFIQAIPREAIPPSYFERDGEESALPPDWIAVAVAVDGMYAVFWACNIIGDRFVSSCILSHNFLEAPGTGDGDRVRCAAVVAFQSCMRMSADAFPAYLHTGHADGTVRQWIFAVNAEGELVLSETLRVKAHSSPVSGLSVAYFGRFASWCSTEREAKVWQLESSGGAFFELEAAIDCGDDAQRGGWGAHFDWTPLYDGVDTLAVAAGCAVRVLAQASDIESSRPVWRDVAVHGENVVATPLSGPPCSALAWTYNGTLVAAFGHEMRVFSRFVPSGPLPTNVVPPSSSRTPVPGMPFSPSGSPTPRSATPSSSPSGAVAIPSTTVRMAMGARKPVKTEWEKEQLSPEELEPAPEEDKGLPKPPDAKALAEMMAKEREIAETTGIFARAMSLHRAMPLYHPYILEHWLHAGAFDRVDCILRALLPYLEALADPARSRTAAFSLGVDSILDDHPVVQQQQQQPAPTAADSSEGEAEEPSDLMETEEGKRLAALLASVRLPGVDFAAQARISAIAQAAKRAKSVASALDPAGAKFVGAYFLFNELQRMLPEGHAQRPAAMRSSDFAWALLSDAQDRILAECLPGEATWEDARAIGVGYWLQNPTALRTLAERIAKASFQKNKDPADCALFYLALGKKSALLALYKMIKDTKITKFLTNDFTEQKWKAAAARNAFVLEGQHRPLFAAAFFLLGGYLADCLHVCDSKLDDLQLSLLIARLYEPGTVSSGGSVVMGPAAHKLLAERIAPDAAQRGDACLECVARWRLREHEQALRALGSAKTFDPMALQLFSHLRGHILLRDTPVEARSDVALLRRALYAFHSSGCEVLALQALRTLRLSVDENAREEERRTKEEAEKREKEQEEERQRLMAPKDAPKKAPLPAASADDEWDFISKPKDEDDWMNDLSGGSGTSVKKPIIEQEEDDFLYKRQDDWMDDLDAPAPKPATATTVVFLNSEGRQDHEEKPSLLGEKDSKKKDVPEPPKTAESLMIEHNKQRLEAQAEAERRTAAAEKAKRIENALHQTLLFGAALRSTIREVAESDAESQAASNAMKTWSNCTGIPQLQVVKAVLEFCYVYGYYAQESAMARSAENPENALQAVAQAVLDCATHARTFPELLVAHTPSIAFCKTLETVARQLFQCYQTTRTHISPAGRRRIEFATYLGLFLSWWRQKKWHLVRELLNYDVEGALAYTVRLPADTLPTPESLRMSFDGGEEPYEFSGQHGKKKVELPDEYDKEAVSRFAERFIALLSVHAAVTRLTSYFAKPMQSGGYSSSRTPVAQQPSAQSSQDETKDTESVVRALERWAMVMEQRLSLVVPSPEEVGAAPGLHAKTLMALVRESNIVKTNNTLWTLFRMQFKVLMHSVKRRIVCGPGEAARFLNRHLMVGESVTKHHFDNSVLLSFCISSEFKYAAVATQRNGIKEVDIAARAFTEADGDSDNDFEDNALAAAQQQEQAQQMQGMRRASVINTPGAPGQLPLSGSVPVPRAASPHITTAPSPLRSDAITITPAHSGPASPLLSDDDDSPSPAGVSPQDKMLRPVPFARAVSPAFFDGTNNTSPREPSPPPRLTTMLKKGSQSFKMTAAGPFQEGTTPCSRSGIVANFVDSHPFFPYYISAGTDGKVKLWQFLIPRELASFQMHKTSPTVLNRARFSPTGMRFGAVDKSGYFALWSFSAGDADGNPFYKVLAHSREATDLAFLNSGSFIATCGSTNEPKRSVKLWDTLLPSHSACVAESTTITDRVSCIAYSPRYQLLLAGDKKGYIHSFDIRKFVPMKTVKAHNDVMTSLAYGQDKLFSACVDGVVKIWSLPTLTQEHVLEAPHGSVRSKLNQGVTNLQVGERDGRLVLFTCGGDNRLLEHPIQFTV